ncbi:hypothetical protein BGZ70_006161 [Mortierella alpina]|uniref:Uncharacterized protein n=1 Tax=Mortierella alpina TaxID=64518 RepID=A0A9P6J8G7_MORAP|nr:hypothetical protein BGZ70_006161 [Mortierella alpina]
MSNSSTPHQQIVLVEEAPATYQDHLERAQSQLAHFQVLLSQQEQRQLDAELAYKQRIEKLRKDLKTTKQELVRIQKSEHQHNLHLAELEDCVQGHVTRAAAHASSTYALKQQRQQLQDENNRLRVSLRSAEEELTKVTLRVEALENRTRRMSQELQNNELLKAELLERHLAGTILESQVDKLMDVEHRIMGRGVQVLDAEYDELEAGSIHPSQTLFEELQNACSDSRAPVPSSSSMPESAEILECVGQVQCFEPELQVTSVSSFNDSWGQPLGSDKVDTSLTSVKFLAATTGNADQLVRVLGHYLHQHYQHAVGGRQKQQYNPFSWFIKTSAIVTISWAAMTMQMLSMVETLVGDVERGAQVPT